MANWPLRLRLTSLSHMSDDIAVSLTIALFKSKKKI